MQVPALVEAETETLVALIAPALQVILIADSSSLR